MGQYVDLTLAEGEHVLVRGRWPWTYWVGAWIWLLVLGIAIIGVIMFVRLIVRMHTTEFAVTDRRVVLKTGLIHRRTREIDVSSIESVQLKQSLWGRLFGYGSVQVTGTGEAVILFPPMADPVTFRKAIESGRPQRRA